MRTHAVADLVHPLRRKLVRRGGPRGSLAPLAGFALLATLAVSLPAEAQFAPSEDPPWVGIELDLGHKGGVLIKRVLEGAPGERAHLAPGDEVLAVDGKPVSAPEQLSRAVRARAVGEIVHFTVHGTPPREVLVKLEKKPAPGVYQKRALLGRPAPDFTAAVAAGPKLGKLSSQKGQVVLLDFFATWCLPCMQALPRVQALHKELGARGLRVVGISGEPPAIVGAVAARGVDYTLAADNEEAVAARYHVTALPTMVVIDREGVVRDVRVGDEAGTERVVRELLGAAPAPPAPAPAVAN